MLIPLIACGFVQVAFTLRNNELLTTQQHHIIMCITDIINRHFTPWQPLHVSLPAYISQTNNGLQMVDNLLGILHDKIHWQLHVSLAGGMTFEAVQHNYEKPYSYVLFTSSEREENVTVDLLSQMDIMNSKSFLNPRAKFLVVISEHLSASPKLLALSIISNLYKYYKIINLVVLTPIYKPLFPDEAENLTHSGRHQLNIYTWFPFTSSEYCNTVKDVTHLDTWLVGKQGYFLNGVNLFPEKIPRNLNGCPIKITWVSPQEDTETRLHYNTENGAIPHFAQIEINFVASLLQKLNLTIIYDIQPANNMSHIKQIFYLMDKLVSGACDVAFGGLPLHIRFTVFAEATVPYFQTGLSWFVPCAKHLYRPGTIFRVLSLPVWFCFGVVFLLVVATTWILAIRAKTIESKRYINLANCCYIVWSATMSVSVPQMPRTSLIRLFFLLWVLHCFAMTTVFEAFFTSFLVEPEMEKQIESVEELVSSGLEYGYPSSLDKYVEEINDWTYKEIRLRHSDCISYESCVERAIQSDFATVSSTYLVDYVLASMISNELSHPLCQMSRNVISYSVSMQLSKGNPLLGSINQIIKRHTESGLADRFFRNFRNSSMKKYMLLFKVKEHKSSNDADIYVAFSLFHLHFVFVSLFIGLVVSTVSFLCEITYLRNK